MCATCGAQSSGCVILRKTLAVPEAHPSYLSRRVLLGFTHDLGLSTRAIILYCTVNFGSPYPQLTVSTSRARYLAFLCIPNTSSGTKLGASKRWQEKRESIWFTSNQHVVFSWTMASRDRRQLRSSRWRWGWQVGGVGVGGRQLRFLGVKINTSEALSSEKMAGADI